MRALFPLVALGLLTAPPIDDPIDAPNAAADQAVVPQDAGESTRVSLEEGPAGSRAQGDAHGRPKIEPEPALKDAVAVEGPPPPSPPAGSRPTPERIGSRYRTVVRPQRRRDGRDAQRRLDARTPGLSTAIELEEEEGVRMGDALPDVLRQRAGIVVRSIGGLGQFSSVSLRGSTAAQVEIFLDGAPLSRSQAGLVDLGAMPLDTLSRVEVHRGYVPIQYGGATIGGAIDLVSRASSGPARLRVGGGMGSFGAREARASMSIPLPRGLSLGVHAGYGGSEGTFRAFDPGSTPQLESDDRFVLRRNAGFDRGLAQVRLDGERSGTRGSIQVLGITRHQGIPGPIAAPSRAASLQSQELRTVGRIQRDLAELSGARIEWVSALGVSAQHFRDPIDELGVGVDNQRAWGLDAYVSPRMRLPLWRAAHLGMSADGRFEQLNVREAQPPQDPLLGSGDAIRRRGAVGLGVELEQRLAKGRILLVPALRLDAIESRFRQPPGEGEFEDVGGDTTTYAASPRLGTRFQLHKVVSLRSSIGRYFRPPSLLELFGDRGYAIGNEGLRSETGTSADLGVVIDARVGRGWKHDLYAQVGVFAADARNLIQWVQAGSVVRPENLTHAQTGGAELSFSWSGLDRALMLRADYMLLASRNLSSDPEINGAPLPGRPLHQGQLRLSPGWEAPTRSGYIEPRLSYGLEVVAQNYLDQSARFALPPRVLHSLGIELHIDRRVHLAVDVRNLTDRIRTTWTPPISSVGPIPVAVTDFIGYPLPGRSIWASLRIDLDWTEADREQRRQRRAAR